VKLFQRESPKDAYLSGEVARGHDLERRGLHGAEGGQGPAVRVRPRALAVDGQPRHPRKAPNPAAAHKFIDFLLRRRSQAHHGGRGYTSPNLAAIALLPEKVRNNRTAYPSAEDLAKGEFQVDVARPYLFTRSFGKGSKRASSGPAPEPHKPLTLLAVD